MITSAWRRRERERERERDRDRDGEKNDHTLYNPVGRAARVLSGALVFQEDITAILRDCRSFRIFVSRLEIPITSTASFDSLNAWGNVDETTANS
jgi:hypothetical protein